MSLDDLPNHILYNICRYLSFTNIQNLSRSCKELYISIEKDDYFWMILIKNHFGFQLYQRYVHEIFDNKKNSDYVLYRTDKDKEKFEKSFQKKRVFYVCTTWILNMLNGNENSDDYVAYKSVMKQKLCPRTNQLKMSLTIDEFFQHYVKKNKHLNKENISLISFYKLIYCYLIESKRLLGVDLFGINLRCTLNHLHCTNQLYPKQESDLNCLTGRCVRLYSDPSLYLAGIKGKFQSILPGIYEIICRIKLDKNQEYLTYYKQCCSKNPGIEENMRCDFYALADHGVICECSREKMNINWFESNYLLHGNLNWFNKTMGKIKVFELSDIYFGFRTEWDLCYRNILFDYIQLNIVE